MRTSVFRSHFRLGIPVVGDDFFGRKEQLSEIHSLLQTGSAVNFFSLRRMGKSSLLRQISYLCKSDDKWSSCHPVFLDAMGSVGTLSRHLLYELGIHQHQLRNDEAWLAIEKNLRNVSEKTLLLIDESNYWIEIQKDEAKAELAPIRALHQSGAVNIVASSLYGSIVDQLQELSDLSSPFYNIFCTFRLPAFKPSESEELLDTLFDRGGLRLDRCYASELGRYVGYYPNLVQEIGHIAFENRAEGKGYGLEDVKQEWLGRYGYHWLPTILAPFKHDYIGAIARFAGVSREEFLANSYEVYGILLRDENGDLVPAPYMVDLLSRSHYSEGESVLEHLNAIANSFSTKNKQSLETVIERSLRLAFKEKPPYSEREVQHFLDVILCASGYTFVREGPTFFFSLKGYRPDFSNDAQQLVVEVKLCRGKDDVNRVIEEMNADINPYLERYSSVLFVVFDLGGIYDVEKFSKDFERDDRIHVVVVKR